ncbi:MAG: hypothetical protein NWS48_02605 [Akkermansiaceae bacterium]|nr:hypothetical protein [Akkermansiaceae bacterium]MDP4994809.1 hypothetical protein [Akkermansiaceae bacterium]
MANAELPSLSTAPWVGFFAGLDSKTYRLGISARGEINLNPWHKKGAVHAYHFIPVTWGIERTLPDGRTRVFEVLPDSLESDDQANSELETTIIRGETTGGAKVELTVTEDDGVMHFKTRLLDPGQLPADSIRPVICTLVQNYYGTTKARMSSKPDEFLELLEDNKDSLKLTQVDGKTKKFDFIEPVTAASDEVTGAGVTEAEVDVRFIDHTYIFAATGASALTLENKEGEPFHAGFKMVWRADEAKDAKHEATLAISVK